MMNIFYGLLIAAPVCWVSVWKRALRVSGGIAAGALIVLLSWLGGVGWAAVLVFAFVLIAGADAAVGRFVPKKEHAPRGARQVAENGLAALTAAVCWRIFGNPAFAAAFVVALGESLADSLASDVGVLSRREPVDICRLRPVSRGVSGGVSVLGTLAALGGSVVNAAFAVPVLKLPWSMAAWVALLPMAGMLLDSVLGSLVQARFRCRVCGKATEKPVHCGKPAEHISGIRRLDNGTVNLVTNLITAAAAAAILL